MIRRILKWIYHAKHRPRKFSLVRTTKLIRLSERACAAQRIAQLNWKLTCDNARYRAALERHGRPLEALDAVNFSEIATAVRAELDERPESEVRIRPVGLQVEAVERVLP